MFASDLMTNKRVSEDATTSSGSSRQSLTRLWPLGLLIAGVAAPFILSDYSNFQLTRVLAIALAVLSLNLLAGYAGQLSVGHGALMGLGGYTTVIICGETGLPYPLALVVATIVGFLAGLIFGIPSLRVGGYYLALITLGLALIFPAMLRQFSDLTGGALGYMILSPDAPSFLPLTRAQWLYLLTFAVFVLSFTLVRRLVTGRFGRALDAIRENETMAATNGIKVGLTKATVFAISSALAALAGGLYQLLLGPATTETYQFHLSALLLTACVIGGARSLYGALLGAAFVIYVPDLATGLGDKGTQLIYSIVLLLFVYFVGGGVTGLWIRIRARFITRSA